MFTGCKEKEKEEESRREDQNIETLTDIEGEYSLLANALPQAMATEQLLLCQAKPTM
jgi:hypothetical protein